MLGPVTASIDDRIPRFGTYRAKVHVTIAAALFNLRREFAGCTAAMETHDSMPAADEPFDDVTADKSRSAQDEDVHDVVTSRSEVRQFNTLTRIARFSSPSLSFRPAVGTSP